MSLQTFVFVIFCAGACFGCNTNSCENKQNLSDVIIPQAHLFEQETFNNFILGATLKEAYVLFPDPAPFTVGSNFNCEITEVDVTTYQLVCTGLIPQCSGYTITLSTVSQGNKISFTYRDLSNIVIHSYYWSPCPSKFILRLECPVGSLLQNNKCSVTGARINVFLVGDVNLSNAPWNDISKEIFIATGVRFGHIDGMDWYFTGSTGTPCVP